MQALDLPQVDCVSAEDARDAREASEYERRKSRVTTSPAET